MAENDKQNFSRNRKPPMGGPGGMGRPGEKAKDFKSASKRLIKELGHFKIAIVIALILAIMGAVLSISAPNRLSSLTDEISSGLAINSEEVVTDIFKNFNTKKYQTILMEILNVNLSEENINEILSSDQVSDENKQILQAYLASVANTGADVDSKTTMMALKVLGSLPDDLLAKVLQTETIDNIEVSSADKITLFHTIYEQYQSMMELSSELQGTEATISESNIGSTSKSNSTATAEINESTELNVSNESESAVNDTDNSSVNNAEKSVVSGTDDSSESDTNGTSSSGLNMPESIQKVFMAKFATDSIRDEDFGEFKIDGVTISQNSQHQFMKAMAELTISNDSDKTTKFYSALDQLPEDFRNIIKPKMNFDNIKKISLIIAIIYICSALFTYIQSILMTIVSNKFAQKLRARISQKINKLPLKYFDRHQTGDTLSRVTNDVDTIAQSMNQSLANLVSSVTLFFGTLIMMFITNWIMAITAVLASFIGFAGMIVILKNSQKYFVSRQVELGNLNSHIEEVYSGLNVVKVYNGKKKSDEEFDKLNKKVAECNRKSQFLSGLMQPLMNFIGNFGYVAVCIVGAILTMNDVITFGVIVAFITYVRLFTSPLSQIAQAMTALQSTAAASERVFEFVDEEEMDTENRIRKHIDKNRVKGNIEFKNVVFQYDNNDKPTIKNFTASIKDGQKVAIVGPTGAGKTTMVNLLMKFYDINSGEIIIDGVSTKNLKRANIHDLFTMVLQDTWLFDGTIKENIIYNRANISDERVKEVCEEVGLHHFIATLPNGYDTLLSESDSVSSGQRQLLTIARGMIEDSPFLILDEATSNVDTRTEELVQAAMDKLMKGRTSFIIAHRLSTIKNADLILVMKDGNIIEHGNHEELMAQNGFYADLYNSQFEL